MDINKELLKALQDMVDSHLPGPNHSNRAEAYHNAKMLLKNIKQDI